MQTLGTLLGVRLATSLKVSTDNKNESFSCKYVILNFIDMSNIL